MSYTAGILAIMSMYGGYQNAKANQAGLGMKADEFDLVADEALLTHHFNKKQRDKETMSLTYQTLAQGMDKAGVMGLSGLKTVENIKAETGSSGAMMGVGTTNEVVINQHLQNASKQLAIQQQTKERVSNIQQNANSINQMEDWKIKMKVAKLRRSAAQTRAGADSAFFAGMLNAFTGSAQTYTGAGGRYESGSFANLFGS